jgi:uncharacterized protein YtpQ (UPF0354 family)
VLSAEGLLASSMPFLAEVPEQLEARVRGEPVAAVPTRDELFVAGNEERMAVTLLRAMAEKYHREGQYPVSTSLAAWRGGQCEAYRTV